MLENTYNTSFEQSGEPPVLSLLEGNPSYYSKDIENTFRHSLVREAIDRGDAENAARIFLESHRHRMVLQSASI